MSASLNQRTTLRAVWRIMLWGGLATLLSLPALAMSLGAEGVDWSLSDFIVMGALLTILGLMIEAAMRLCGSWPARLAGVAMALIVFSAIWVELAVGVFGTPFAGS